MKKRRIITLIISCIGIAFLGIFLGLLFHEAGHALMGVCCEAPISNFHIGVLSYVELNVAEATDLQLAMISIGSFILPEIMYIVLMFFKNFYINLIRIFSGMHLYMHILFSICIIIAGSNQPENWDILMFQNYSKLDFRILVAGLIVMLVANIILEMLSGRIKSAILYIVDQID